MVGGSQQGDPMALEIPLRFVDFDLLFFGFIANKVIGTRARVEEGKLRNSSASMMGIYPFSGDRNENPLDYRD